MGFDDGLRNITYSSFSIRNHSIGSITAMRNIWEAY